MRYFCKYNHTMPDLCEYNHSMPDLGEYNHSMPDLYGYNQTMLDFCEYGNHHFVQSCITFTDMPAINKVHQIKKKTVVIK